MKYNSLLDYIKHTNISMQAQISYAETYQNKHRYIGGAVAG